MSELVYSKLKNTFRKSSTKIVAISGIGIALLFVVTAFVQMPMPGSGGGYVHLGDSVLFVVSFVFGPVVGSLTGGGGGFFADLYLGYPMYAGFSLVIKAVQGLIVGVLSKRYGKNIFGYVYTMMVAGIWMVVAYFLVEILLFNFEVALASIVGNVLQVVAGIVFAMFAFSTVQRLHRANDLQAQNEKMLDDISAGVD